MKKTIPTNWSFLFCVLLLSACTSVSHNLSEEASFLAGTWKAQGMEEYEVWQKQSEGSYSGYAYRIKDGEKVIWERMRVSKENGQWQLAVRVPEQNEGTAIVFKLHSDPQVEWLFVNPDHDFPKSILYRKVSEREWFADVRGDDNKGFSIVIERQQ